MKMKRLAMACTGLLLAQGLAFEAMAADPMICAATAVTECTLLGECSKGTPESFNLPVLFKVDVANKQVESIRLNKEKRKSAIATANEADGLVLLMGVDGVAGWSAIINRESGQMTVVSSRDGASYTVFGTCAGL